MTKSSDHVTFHTPAKNQGQAIEISFGADAEYIYRRTVDRSENSTVIERCSFSGIESVVDDSAAIDSWEPWSGGPPSEDQLPWETIEAG